MVEILAKASQNPDALRIWPCRIASGRFICSQRDDKIVKLLMKTSYCTTWKKNDQK